MRDAILQFLLAALAEIVEVTAETKPVRFILRLKCDVFVFVLLVHGSDLICTNPVPLQRGQT
jgi:hypothetical protein